VREAAAFALLACACGVTLHRTDPSRAAPQPDPKATAASTALPPETAAAFDALANRGRAAAPGMHEVARKETAGERVELVRAEARDLCVRVAFESSAPVTAKLVDGVGNVLVASGPASTEGVLGERGPVCVRRGELVACVADGGPAQIRWVAWAAP
jgi:hypothetical protein